MPRPRRRYDNEALQRAVQRSTSIREVLTLLGLVAAGGNYKTVKRALEEHDIDTSHFLGSAWLRGRRNESGRRRAHALEAVLVEGSTYQTSRLRERLLAAGVFERRCYGCDLREWRGRPIPLELEHLNGQNDDHRLDNLTLLCPNCHALTDSYRGRNKGRYQRTR